MQRLTAIILGTGLLLIGACGSKQQGINKQNGNVSGILMDLGSRIGRVPHHSILQDPNYFIWGASMVQGKDQKYHLYYSRWPKSVGFGGWLDHSEIAYAIADAPGGPYRHQKVLLRGYGKGHWNEQSAHNPHIKSFGGKYYLYFISHVNNDFGRGSERENHRWGQRIGVAVSEHPAGPWRVSENPLIDYQEGKGAEGYMVNPSVCQMPDGNYLMVFKTRSNQAELSKRMIQCTAIAKHPEGPFVIADEPILTDKEAEDPFVWFYKGRYYALLDDQRGLYTGQHGLALFESMDGAQWQASQTPKVMGPKIQWENGQWSTLKYLERPQLWFNEKGEPAMLFCAAQFQEANDSIPHTFNVHIPVLE